MALSVALQTYSVREEMDRDPEKTLWYIEKLYFTGVELDGLHGQTPAVMARLLRKAHLEAVCTHVSFKELAGDIPLLCDKYAEVGCRYLALAGLPEGMLPGQAEFEEACVRLHEAAEAVARCGMYLLYHNHTREFVDVGRDANTWGLDVLLEQAGEALLCELDTCWAALSGVDPAAYIRRYAGRMPLVHLKDYRPVDDETAPGTIVAGEAELRPLGRGILNLPAVLNACQASGVQWLVVEQDESLPEFAPLEAAGLSRQYLRMLGW